MAIGDAVEILSPMADRIARASVHPLATSLVLICYDHETGLSSSVWWLGLIVGA